MGKHDIGIGKANPKLAALQEIIGKRSQSEVDLLWNLVSLFMFERFKTEDMVKIYKEIGVDAFVKLVYAVGGKEVKFPTREELLDNLVAALIYVDKELRKLSWPNIKKKYPTIDVRSIKYAIKIKNLDSFMEMQVAQLLKDYGVETEEKLDGKEV